MAALARSTTRLADHPGAKPLQYRGHWVSEDRAAVTVAGEEQPNRCRAASRGYNQRARVSCVTETGRADFNLVCEFNQTWDRHVANARVANGYRYVYGCYQ